MSGYDIKKHKDEIITSIIQNLIWIPVVAIVTIILNVIKSLYNNFTTANKLPEYIIILAIIAIILSAVSIFFCFSLYIKNKKQQKTSSNNETIAPIITTNVRIENVSAELLFKTREDIESSLEYHLIANEDNVEYFEKEIIWTGKEYHDTELIEKDGNYEFKLLNNNETLHTYRVNFLDKIHISDQMNFKILTKVSDTDHSMLPINSYMVKHQINSLIIRVVTPKGLIKNVWGSVYIDLYRKIKVGNSVSVQKREIGHQEYYEITFPTPTITHRYCIEWEFTKK